MPAKKKKAYQTGKSNIKKDKQRKALPPGKRKSSSGATYYERRKNRSDVPGTLTGMSEVKLRSELKKRVNDKIDALVVKKFRSTKKVEKRKLGKEITKMKIKLRKLL